MFNLFIISFCWIYPSLLSTITSLSLFIYITSNIHIQNIHHDYEFILILNWFNLYDYTLILLSLLQKHLYLWPFQTDPHGRLFWKARVGFQITGLIPVSWLLSLNRHPYGRNNECQRVSGLSYLQLRILPSSYKVPNPIFFSAFKIVAQSFLFWIVLIPSDSQVPDCTVE